VLPQILGDLPDLRDALYAAANPDIVQQANRLLLQIRERAYPGRSNWAAPDSFVGGNFSFRP